MNFKTKELSRGAIEHLISVGYKLINDISIIEDCPYLLISDNVINKCYSANQYRTFFGQEKTQPQVLKIQKEISVKERKKLTAKEKGAYKLLKLLNNQKNSKITGYDVSWTIQERKHDSQLEILPISPHACGSISMKHLEIVLNFAKDYTWMYPSISYTNYNGENERYGTYTPCILLF